MSRPPFTAARKVDSLEHRVFDINRRDNWSREGSRRVYVRHIQCCYGHRESRIGEVSEGLL